MLHAIPNNEARAVSYFFVNRVYQNLSRPVKNIEAQEL